MICDSAVEAARAVGYYNAGTVEFIFDLDSNKHYFMEMNTRLQVEHPISEMITGYDFVEWQLLVASGFPLPKKQSEINKKGNAIEVRIYAEDPFNGFLPGNGKLKYLREPVENQGVRIETGVRDKDVISTYYDPMIAKLITYGATREEAIELMRQALKDYRVVGLNNNLKFLKRVFDNGVFRQGDYDTGFIEQNIASLLNKDQSVDPFDLVTAVAARNVANGEKLGLPADLVDYKNVRGQKQLQRIVVNETSLAKELKWEVEVDRQNLNKGSVVLDGKTYQY
jgi:3-methylcrotonyl-CoA carboxylase alpha subunit